MGQSGTIFNIQPFSVYDGPGIRTTVFFKGCNLRCAWCHNPESYLLKPQIQFQPEACIGCGECFSLCPQGAHVPALDGSHLIDRTRCTGCGKCADSCFAGALALTGKTMTASAVFSVLMQDRPYFVRSGGGVTFSGGECMLQLEFLKALLRLCKQEEIHTAVDTAGHVPFEQLLEILPLTDLFLYDVKAARGDTHKKLTGVGNEQILSNLRALSDRGVRLIVRVPYIPGANDGEMPEIAEILRPLHLEAVELLAYHPLGEGKRAALGMEGARFDSPESDAVEKVCRQFSALGIPARCQK